MVRDPHLYTNHNFYPDRNRHADPNPFYHPNLHAHIHFYPDPIPTPTPAPVHKKKKTAKKHVTAPPPKKPAPPPPPVAPEAKPICNAPSLSTVVAESGTNNTFATAQNLGALESQASRCKAA